MLSSPIPLRPRCERERQRLRAEVEALSQKLAVQEEELAAGEDGEDGRQGLWVLNGEP